LSDGGKKGSQLGNIGLCEAQGKKRDRRIDRRAERRYLLECAWRKVRRPGLVGLKRHHCLFHELPQKKRERRVGNLKTPNQSELPNGGSKQNGELMVPRNKKKREEKAKLGGNKVSLRERTKSASFTKNSW